MISKYINSYMLTPAGGFVRPGGPIRCGCSDVLRLSVHKRDHFADSSAHQGRCGPYCDGDCVSVPVEIELGLEKVHGPFF